MHHVQFRVDDADAGSPVWRVCFRTIWYNAGAADTVFAYLERDGARDRRILEMPPVDRAQR